MDAGNLAAATPPAKSDLPAYDAELRRYHEAFAAELRQAVEDLPLRAGMAVLDVPCGDGFYSRLLAERAGPTGKVVGGDQLPAYVEMAETAARRAGLSDVTEFVLANAYALPFDDNSFDLVWCAQSLVSLGDPAAALGEMRRVVRPGGLVTILECDEFHHLQLPWPTGVETYVQAALREASEAEYESPNKRYVSRQMRRLLRAAGLAPQRRRSYTADRAAPLDRATQRFLEEYLENLRTTVHERLPPEPLRLFEQVADPASRNYLPASEDFEMTCLFTIWLAAKSQDA